MNENQRKWLRELQSKEVMFDIFEKDKTWWLYAGNAFCQLDTFRIRAQPIPDIPDWRELCRDMQSKGVMLEHFGLFSQSWGVSSKTKLEIHTDKTKFRIPAQPIPEWGEEMIEEPTAGVTTIANAAALSQAAQILKEELDKIPHRDLQIQWCKDMLHHLRTGEPMREWEFKEGCSERWHLVLKDTPSWSVDLEYRRKPRMQKVTYWHCAVRYMCKETRVIETDVLESTYEKDEVRAQIDHYTTIYPDLQVSPITETTVEISED